MRVSFNDSLAVKLNFSAKINKIPLTRNCSEVALNNLKLKGYTAFIGGDVYTPSNKIAKHDLLFHDKKLIAVDNYSEKAINGNVDYVILEGKTITPAIMDEHIHGGFGISFHNSCESEIRTLLKKLAIGGTAGVIATTLPDSSENISKQIELLSSIIENPKDDEARIFGIHLEGPFLNSNKSGIHPPEILQKPSIENYLKLNPRNVKIVTLAPELDDNYDLCKFLRSQGVNVSAGHTVASSEQIIKSGVNQVTHIFNAMSPLHQRNENVTLEALTNDNLYTEMIGEFSHLSPKIMNLIMRVKPENRIILISDALPNAGVKKDFVMNGVKVHVFDNWRAMSDDGVIAGSMRFLQNLASSLIKNTNMTFRQFIRFAAVNPAQNNGVLNKFILKTGKYPIFSIWDNKNLIPEKTFIF